MFPLGMLLIRWRKEINKDSLKSLYDWMNEIVIISHRIWESYMEYKWMYLITVIYDIYWGNKRYTRDDIRED